MFTLLILFLNSLNKFQCVDYGFTVLKLFSGPEDEGTYDVVQGHTGIINGSTS